MKEECWSTAINHSRAGSKCFEKLVMYRAWFLLLLLEAPIRDQRISTNLLPSVRYTLLATYISVWRSAEAVINSAFVPQFPSLYIQVSTKMISRSGR